MKKIIAHFDPLPSKMADYIAEADTKIEITRAKAAEQIKRARGMCAGHIYQLKSKVKKEAERRFSAQVDELEKHARLEITKAKQNLLNKMSSYGSEVISTFLTEIANHSASVSEDFIESTLQSLLHRLIDNSNTSICLSGKDSSSAKLNSLLTKNRLTLNQTGLQEPGSFTLFSEHGEISVSLRRAIQDYLQLHASSSSIARIISINDEDLNNAA